MNNLLLFPDIRPERKEEQTPAPPVIADERERSAALDTSASWIVEAPAGSGKTGLLMQRFLKLLASDSVAHPDEVLAITFTRKATAELRERVLEQLEAAHGAIPLPENANLFAQQTRTLAKEVLTRSSLLGWGLLENTDQIRIQTIDAVCSEIARALPLLSGSGGSGQPVDDARPLHRLAARRTLMHLGGRDAVLHNAIETVLLHRDGDLGNCESLLAAMLAQREQWAELVPLDRASLADDVLDTQVRARLEANLQRVVCAGLSRALQLIPSDALHELNRIAQRIAGEPDHPTDSVLAICASKSIPPGVNADHLEHWIALAHLLLTKEGAPRKAFPANHLGFSTAKAQQAEIRELASNLRSEEAYAALHSIRALPLPRYPDHQWDVAKALFRLLLHALAELKVLFAERGECDFTEMSLAARAALSTDNGGNDLASASGRTLRHLLVDEMQDTSSAQYDLLQLLTQSWDGHSQTLFLVGDPKQSIYIFRQARVERFLRTVREERIGDVSLQALRLTANFRSQGKLVEAFNDDFSLLFPSPEEWRERPDPDDVPFVSATAVRPREQARSIQWHTGILTAKDSAGRRARALSEAREVRRIVEQWQQQPLPAERHEPWRIAVLARARNHLAPIVAEFQNTSNGAAIPFRAVDVEQLGERQEVLDAFALTRALLHPADRTAWLAVLRAPWCGLAAADLLALTGEGAVASPSETRGEMIASLVVSRSAHMSSDGQRLLQRTWPILQAAQQQARRCALPDLVERTWLSLGGAVPLEPQQRRNVQRFFALLRDSLDNSGQLDLRVLKQSMKDLYAEAASMPQAVDLMTIHKAKGLEWDVVLIPGLERQGQVSRYELLNWLELEATGKDSASVLLAPIHEVGDKPGTLSKWIRDTKERREEAERKRLLYVACTRAREELHLFAACERKKGGELSVPRGTLLKSFWPAAESKFAQFTQPYLGETWSEQTQDQEPEQEHESEQEEGFAIAAVADLGVETQQRRWPMLQRLPADFDPEGALRAALANRLPYPAAPPPAQSAAFERPEGSFAIRAFGNTVHRFLELIAKRMEEGSTADALLHELPSWQPRLLASLRSEGLPPASCTRESSRALQTITAALSDPVGQWILAPRASAASEATLTLAGAGQLSTMRVDRTFCAGIAPLSTTSDVLWIVDFKTTEQGSRSPSRFEEEERAKYGPQLARYAELLRAAERHDQPIMLGLYYPAVPRFIYWPSEGLTQ